MFLVALAMCESFTRFPGVRATTLAQGRITNETWDWYKVAPLNETNPLVTVSVTSNNTAYNASSRFLAAVLIATRVQPPQKIGETAYEVISNFTESRSVQISYNITSSAQRAEGVYVLVISIADSNPAINYSLACSHPLHRYSYGRYYEEVVKPRTDPIVNAILILVIGTGIVLTMYLVNRRIREKRLVAQQQSRA